MKVGLIGLGAMGLGMARNLAKVNLLTAVYNRTENKAKAFVMDTTIICCTSPQQLARQVDIILICVSADEDVLEIVIAISTTIKPRSIVVDMSTVGRETAEKSALILAKKHARFLDAPVSGGVEGAKKGTLAMMVGGDLEILEKVHPVLKNIATRIMHMGKVGTGQGTKAVNQVMAAGINQAVTEALAFAQLQGLAMDKVIEVISGGAASNWFLEHRGTSMINNVFDAGFKLALHHKDLKICQKMVAQKGHSIDLLDQTVVDYEILIKQGFGDEDISRLYCLKNK